jgi:hypothetical protein
LVTAESRSALAVARGRSVEVDIRALARGAQMAPGRWRDRRRWAAPDANVETRRRWCNVLGPASRRLGRAWRSDTLGMARAPPVA